MHTTSPRTGKAATASTRSSPTHDVVTVVVVVCGGCDSTRELRHHLRKAVLANQRLVKDAKSRKAQVAVLETSESALLTELTNLKVR